MPYRSLHASKATGSVVRDADHPPSTAFVASLATITLIGPLAVHLFLPAIPVVKHELGVSDAMAQLTFSAALIAMAFSTLIYGSLADNLPDRKAFGSATLAHCGACSGSALAPLARTGGPIGHQRLDPIQNAMPIFAALVLHGRAANRSAGS